MAAAPLYCVCRQPYDVSRFMIECDICKDWFHGRYVDYISSQTGVSFERAHKYQLFERGDDHEAVVAAS